MKRFEDNYAPIEIEVADTKGNMATLKSKFMSQKDWLEVGKLKADENSANETSTLNCKIMARLFGGDPKEYLRYSSDLLKEVIDYYYSELGKNPRKAQDNLKQS